MPSSMAPLFLPKAPRVLFVGVLEHVSLLWRVNWDNGPVKEKRLRHVVLIPHTGGILGVGPFQPGRSMALRLPLPTRFPYF